MQALAKRRTRIMRTALYEVEGHWVASVTGLVTRERGGRGGGGGGDGAGDGTNLPPPPSALSVESPPKATAGPRSVQEHRAYVQQRQKEREEAASRAALASTNPAEGDATGGGTTQGESRGENQVTRPSSSSGDDVESNHRRRVRARAASRPLHGAKGELVGRLAPNCARSAAFSTSARPHALVPPPPLSLAQRHVPSPPSTTALAMHARKHVLNDGTSRTYFTALDNVRRSGTFVWDPLSPPFPGLSSLEVTALAGE